MEELLYLVHRIPYPPNKGDKIRSYHLLKHLSRHFKVHLGAFIDDPDDWKYAEALKEMVSGEMKLLPLNPAWAKLRSTYGFLSGEPLTVPYYRNAELKNWVGQLTANRPIRHVLVFSSAMSQYVTAYPKLRRIIDFVDIDSDKWRQYSERKSWPLNWVYRREARTLLAFERRIAGTFEASVFVSRAEAALFQQLAPECASRVTYYNNGVDLDYFSPAHDHDNPYPPGERVLAFTGAMDYWANVDAVTWFSREVFPALRAQFPDVRFYIVGSRPTGEVLALAGDGIIVTGSVPDVRPYVAHAAISVAPLRIARGIQNKVLEAMAMAKPVVVSPQALEGIDAKTGREVILANDAAEFIARIAVQLAQPDEALGQAARQRVVQDYSWDRSLQRVDRLLEQARTVTSQVDQPTRYTNEHR
ncbi:MAG: TIGR03087 family PEP-CTERM/XrtA system glycosyltransferase [Nitrosomonadales bacterium]|nr:TIGR03087 family PEP-CTERM/XrtA system glycosyltransferase [Nitrosomonadales bacterium]